MQPESLFWALFAPGWWRRPRLASWLPAGLCASWSWGPGVGAGPQQRRGVVAASPQGQVPSASHSAFFIAVFAWIKQGLLNGDFLILSFLSHLLAEIILKINILLFQSEWILNCFTLFVFRRRRWCPGYLQWGQWFCFCFWLSRFSFPSLRTWGFLCSLCLSAAVIVAGVQMVPRLARCTFHILIWLQLDYWKCFELWDICCILKTEL